MTCRTYTIGQVSRLSGIPVKRLRFYADEGLLPPAGRTASGYRLFDDEDLVRIDLIRAFREAGFGLDAIRKVLARHLPLREALALRLAELEAQIEAQRRVAVTLRAALASPSPTPDNLRRIWTMTSLSQTERRAVIERFFDQVSSDPEINPKWAVQMVKLSTPDLPDEPTAEQIDAWIELSQMVSDPNFVAQMRANARDTKGFGVDEGFQGRYDALTVRIREAVAQRLDPSAEAGRELGREFLALWARATGQEPDAEYLARMKRKHFEHEPNTRRYWQLVHILRGLPEREAPDSEGIWLDRATRAVLQDA
jgi:DNA-binding transcriptional MerR regulator